MDSLKIAVAQMNTTPGDFDRTVAAMLAYGNQAAEQGCGLVVYPAAALMGPDPQTLVADESYQLAMILALKRLACGLKVDALVPFVSCASGSPRFDVAVICGGALKAASAVDGSLPLGTFGDTGRGIFPAADPLAPPVAADVAQLVEPTVVDYRGIALGLALSAADLAAFAEDLTADVICYMPVDAFNADDEQSCLAPSVADGCYAREVRDANAWLVAAGAAGAYDDMVYVGGSFVMAPWGELAAVAPSNAEDLLTCDIDVLDEGPLAQPVDAPAYDRPALRWEALAAAVRDQVSKRGLSGVALVVDGTLASSAVATLAVDAVGPLRVHALVSARDRAALDDARALVRLLRIRDVDEVSARDLDRAASALGDDETDLTAALLQVRLGALARGEGLLALSSADKTELAVGAGAGAHLGGACVAAQAFAPFGDVYRSDVARAARWRNTVSPVMGAGCFERLCVPRGLGLESVATSDEGRLSELDAVLLLRIERHAQTSELVASRLGEQGTLRVLGRLALCEASRRQGPTYPVVSACSLAECGRPVADAWRERVMSEAELAEVDRVRPSGPRAMPRAASTRLAGAPMAPASSAPAGWQAAGAPAAGLDFSIPDEVRDQIGPKAGELMGFLKELADGRRLRGESNRPGKDGPGPWMGGLFSDN